MPSNPKDPILPPATPSVKPQPLTLQTETSPIFRSKPVVPMKACAAIEVLIEYLGSRFGKPFAKTLQTILIGLVALGEDRYFSDASRSRLGKLLLLPALAMRDGMSATQLWGSAAPAGGELRAREAFAADLAEDFAAIAKDPSLFNHVTDQLQ